MNTKLLLLLIGTMLILATTTQGALVYSDNFNNNSYSREWTNTALYTSGGIDSYYMKSNIASGASNTVLPATITGAWRFEYDFYDISAGSRSMFGPSSTTSEATTVSITAEGDPPCSNQYCSLIAGFSFANLGVGYITGQWHHATIIDDGTTNTNFTLVLSNGTRISTIRAGSIDPANIHIYTNPSVTKGWDNLCLWNDTTGGTCGGAPPPPDSGSITAYDYTDNTSISSFNVSFTNATGTLTLSTTNGTIAMPGGYYQVNLTRGDYYPTSQNLTLNASPLVVFPYQAIINLDAYSLYGNQSLSTNNNTFNNSMWFSNRTLFVKAGTIRIDFNRSGFQKTNQTFSITAKTNTTLSFNQVYTGNYTLYVNDQFDGSIINNFTILLNNGTANFTTSTTTGTITIPSHTGNFNSTINGSFYGITYQINTTTLNQTQNKSVTGAILDLKVYEHITNNALNNFTIYANGNTSINGTAYLKAGNNTITVTKSEYLNDTIIVNLIGGTNNTKNLTIFSNRVRIYAKTLSDDGILNFTINITAKNPQHNYTLLYQTSNGTFDLAVIKGNYSLIFIPSNTTMSRQNKTYESNGSYKEITFYGYVINSVNFSYYDERTNNLLNGITIQTELVGTYNAYNTTTTTGHSLFDLITPDGYFIRLIPLTNYTIRTFAFTLTNDSHQDISIYLLTQANSTDITVTVVDEFARDVENAEVILLRYDITTNSYKQVEIGRTSIDGDVVLHAEFNKELYKLFIRYNGVIVSTTNPMYITSLTYTKQINTQTKILKNYFESKNLSYNLLFNEATNTFTYTYSDPTNLMSSTCMKVTKDGLNDPVTVAETCQNTPSGTIQINVTNQSGQQYTALVSALFQQDNFNLQQRTYTYKEVQQFGFFGIFLTGLITIALLCTALVNPVIACIVTPFGLIIGILFGLVQIPMFIGVGFEVVGIILAWLVGDKA